MLTCDCLDEQAVKVDIDVRAMRREVAMREGEARRFATSRAEGATVRRYTRLGVPAYMRS